MIRSTIRLLIQMLILAAMMLYAYEYARHFPSGNLNRLPQPDTLFPPPAPATHRDTGPTIEQVQKLSLLTVTKIEVVDVQETEIAGFLGSVRVLMLIKGDVLISVDLSQARFESKDEQHKLAVLVIPQPRATSPRLDQQKSRVFAISRHGLWVLVPEDPSQTAVINHAFSHAQQVVADAGGNSHLIQESKGNTEQAIRYLFDAMSWTVEIRWS